MQTLTMTDAQTCTFTVAQSNGANLGELSLESSDEAIVTLDFDEGTEPGQTSASGVITAVAAGSATLTVTDTLADGTVLSAEVSVSVVETATPAGEDVELILTLGTPQ